MPTQLKLPENPTPEQFEKLKKPLVKSIIESIYTDGVDDLTVKIPGDEGAIASGKFLDKRIGQANRVFTYILIQENEEFVLDYQPLTGDFAESDPDFSAEYKDDQDIIYEAVRNGQTSPEALGQAVDRMEFTQSLRAQEDLNLSEEDDLDLEAWIANHQQQVQERLFESVRAAGLGVFLEFVEEEEPDWAKV